MKHNHKSLRLFAMLLVFIFVSADVGMHAQYFVHSVNAEEEEYSDPDGSGEPNQDNGDLEPQPDNGNQDPQPVNDNPEPQPGNGDNPNGDNGGDNGGDTPSMPTVALQVSVQPNQISFGNVHRGDIPIPVSFIVTNISSVPVNAFCHPYGDGASIFNVDHPEVTDIQPNQQIKYNVGVLTDNPAGTYNCSLMFDLSTSLIGAKYEAVPAGVSCSVTIVEDVPTGVDSVYISPSSFSMKRGSSYTFAADVIPHTVKDQSVRWSLDGAQSSSTVISSDGKLVVDANESSSHLMVYAAANADPSVISCADVYLEDGYFSVNAIADPAGGGIVSGGGNIKEGADCEVVAAPNNGYVFKGWYYRDKCVSTNKKYYISSVTSNMTLVAKFTKNTAQIIVESSNNDLGTVSDSGYVNIGGSFNIKATPKSNGRFVCWTENNQEVSKNAEYTLQNVTSNRKLTAVFEPNKIQIKLAANPVNAGRLTGAGSYDYNKDIKIKAEPASGYRFVGWLCDNNYFSTDAEATLYQVKRDYSIVAVFEPVNNVTYNVTAKVVGGKGAIFPSGTAPVSKGRDLPIVVTPASGYQVKALVVDGINQGAIPGYVFKNLDREHVVEVTFEPIPGAEGANKKNTSSSKKTADKQDSASKDTADKKNITVTIPDGDDLSAISEEKKQSPEEEAVIPVYDDLAVNDTDASEVTGILQEFGVTPEQAKEHIKDRDSLAYDMFWKAINEGYFDISICNDFAENTHETATAVYEDTNASVHNFIPVMSACTSLDDAVEILSGSRMGYTLSISGYEIGVPSIVKNEVDEAATENGMVVGEYMDFFFAKSRGDNVKPITTLPRGLEFEIVINVPDKLKGISDSFSVVRCHRNEETGELENTLLPDLDDNPDTITIKTGKFSSYGIVYPGSIETVKDSANVKKTPNKAVMICILAALIAAIAVSIIIPLKAVRHRRKHGRR